MDAGVSSLLVRLSFFMKQCRIVHLICFIFGKYSIVQINVKAGFSLEMAVVYCFSFYFLYPSNNTEKQTECKKKIL